MDMLIEQSTKAMDKGYRSDTGALSRTWAMVTQMAFDLTEEDVQDAIEYLGAVLEVVTQRARENP